MLVACVVEVGTVMGIGMTIGMRGVGVANALAADAGAMPAAARTRTTTTTTAAARAHGGRGDGSPAVGREAVTVTTVMVTIITVGMMRIVIMMVAMVVGVVAPTAVRTSHTSIPPAHARCAKVNAAVAVVPWSATRGGVMVGMLGTVVGGMADLLAVVATARAARDRRLAPTAVPVPVLVRAQRPLPSLKALRSGTRVRMRSTSAALGGCGLATPQALGARTRQQLEVLRRLQLVVVVAVWRQQAAGGNP